MNHHHKVGRICQIYHRHNLLSIVYLDFLSLIEYESSIMPTKKPRIILMIEEDLLKQIDDFRYENRIPTRPEAIRQLVKEALKKNRKSKE